MMRKALVVGIDYYVDGNHLSGCVLDSQSVARVLRRNSDDSLNFDVIHRPATGPAEFVSKTQLRAEIRSLFQGDADVALFYFAGHGYVDASWGYLLASDSSEEGEGMPLSELVGFANSSPARNRIIILDSCHSGKAGDSSHTSQLAEIREGVTILTACGENEYAKEADEGGVFTRLLVDALEGAAANLLGQITPGSIYAHIDQSLGGWAQRPVFKTNVKAFVPLRLTVPSIELSELRLLPEFFSRPSEEFQLDPSFEPEEHGRLPDMPPSSPENASKFRVLQRFHRVNLVRPVGAEHMWHAAMQSRSCKLTSLGEHYWRLAKNDRI